MAGHIVITASVSGLFSGAGAGVYVTSKFALVGLAESLRADLREAGIGVSVLCPGPVQSELFESTQEVRPAELAASRIAACGSAWDGSGRYTHISDRSERGGDRRLRTEGCPAQ